MYVCSLAGQPLLLEKRERGSGEQSYIRLSLWNAIQFECDVLATEYTFMYCVTDTLF